MIVGSRWIFEDEECEVIRVVSTTEVEVRFADRRVAISRGPFFSPDPDDFAGWATACVPIDPGKEMVNRPVSPPPALQYQDELDLMGFSGGVYELLQDSATTIDRPEASVFRVATWNASGLVKMSKVRYMAALMAMSQLDMLCIQDSRIEPGQWKDEVERELHRLLGPGSSVFIATVAPRALGSRGPNVGGQILLKSPRIRSACTFSTDSSALGLVCCANLILGSHDVRVVSVYVPPAVGERIDGSFRDGVGSSEEHHHDESELEYRGALALRTRQYIQRSDKWEGCIDYVLGIAQQKIDQQLAIPGGVVFCLGDFNASGSLQDKRSVNGSIEEWTASVGLHHSTLSRQIPCPLTFFRGSEGVSAIDHILFSTGFGVCPMVHRVLDDSIWQSLSNHCPLTVDFLMPGLTNLYVSRRARRKAQIREVLDIGRWGVGGSEEEMPLDLLDYQRYISRRVCVSSLSGSLDDQMECILRVTRAALRSVARRRRKKDWWSPVMVALNANLIAVQEMEKRALGRGRRQWTSDKDWQRGIGCIVCNWERQVRKIGEFKGEGEQIDLLAISGSGPEYWLELGGTVMEKLQVISAEIKRLRRLIRQQEWEETIHRRREKTRLRELARRKGLHLRELRDMMGGRTHFSMDYIVEAGLCTVDEQEVHNKVSSHFQNWFSTKKRDWGFLAEGCDHVRLWSDKAYFMEQHQPSGVPVSLLEVIWKSMRHKRVDPLQQAALEKSLSAAPTIEEFEKELSTTSRHSASGPTGVTYNAIAGWPRDILEKVHTILVQFWNDKKTPRCWKWRWLVPIPKTTENVTLQDLRPLMLTDTIRKVWTGVLIKKIQGHFEQCGLLSPAQHGSLSNRGTEGALVQFRNILEEARESCTDAYLSSWDVVKAFDRLQKNVQLMSWVRLGIPMDVATYLVEMDDLGTTIVRTPYAERVWNREGVGGFSTLGDMDKVAAFAPLVGTGQGNIDSPLVWTAFMDIVLCALAEVGGDQFYVRTNDSEGEGLAMVQEIAYVDDLISMTSRVGGLQGKADVVCACFIIFGMDSARIKFRTFQVEWGSECTSVDNAGVRCKDPSDRKFILIHKDGWKARKVWLQTYQTALPFKYLGVLFDLSNSDAASFARSSEIARRGIAQVHRSLGDVELRVEAILYCVYPRLLYSAKFASWPLRKYLELDKIFSAAFRRILGLRKGFPEELLYAPWGVRGIGLPRFSDEVHMAKLAIINRGSTADRLTRESTASLVLRGFRQQNVKPLYTQAATLEAEFISSQSLFIRSLTEWLLEGGLAIRKGGVDAVGKSYCSLAEVCRQHGTPLLVSERALLEAYGLSAIGDIIMGKEAGLDASLRRGRSRSRLDDESRCRGMEGMRVTTPQGRYIVCRYGNPSYMIRWEDGRFEERERSQVLRDVAEMPIPPVGASLHWVPLPECLRFIYAKIPLFPPQVPSITLSRDQCWASTQGLFPVWEGWVWELLGFANELACVRLWRADLGAAQRCVRPGVRVRLVTPSHGAATNRWVRLSDVFCGEGWNTPGEVFRVLLGPDISSRGIVREVVSIFTQPPTIKFKSEMEIPLLSSIHQHAEAFGDCSIYTDGSVVQECDPVINCFIPSPTIERMLGASPAVAGSMIARPCGPVTHGLNLAFRAENGHLAGCGNSYDIEMVMLAFACLVRDQLRKEGSPSYAVWSDCRSAVVQASQVDLARIRKGGHKEHGLLLRRMFHSRFEDATLLGHVKGHPERRLAKGQRWQELRGNDAGIYLADKLADANMSEDTRYVWDNDGSLRNPLIAVETVEVLRLFASIDLWSIVDLNGNPILDSPLVRVQSKRFTRYLQRRDDRRDEKVWTNYVVTAPAAVFVHERLFHRRAKVTKVVFNWYLRGEHLKGADSVDMGDGVVSESEVAEGLGGGEVVPSAVPLVMNRMCHLCECDLGNDTERHLYVFCKQVDVLAIRTKAEDEIRSVVTAQPEGLVKLSVDRLLTLLLDPLVRHRTWKGIFTPAQIQWIREGGADAVLGDRNTGLLIRKVIRSILHVVGASLLMMRKAAWKLGGVVKVRQGSMSTRGNQQERGKGKTGSILTLLGIMSPKEAVCWELHRRRRRLSKQPDSTGMEGQGTDALESGRQWDVH